MKTAYRVYKAPDGCDPEFCSEHDTYEQAAAEADREPQGLPKCMWETAWAAGHVGGQYAPSDGNEDCEPESWHGAEGWHCVVRVIYDD